MTFKEKPLVELCEIVSSKRVFAASYQSEGVPFFRGKEVSQLARGEDTTAELYISNEVYNDVISRTGPINSGDILLTAVGTLGNPYQVKETDLPFYFKDGNIVWLRKFSKEINSTYLFYWLNSEYGRRKILDTAIGSTQAALTITGLAAISISCPSLAQQTGIVGILSAIDQKITINNVLSKTLEGIAQTIFKSWFIDFDPAKAKMAGAKPAGMDSATASLFPDSMEESELGLIPKGWEIAPIGNALDVGGGTTPSTTNSTYWDGEHCWTTPKDLSSQIGIITTSSTRKITDLGLAQISSGLLPINSVLMSCRAPIGYVSINAVPTAVNQGFITMNHSAEFHPLYVLNWIKANMQEIHNRAGGATFAEITRKAFRDIPFLKPANTLMKKYAELMEPLLKELEQLTRQTENLQVVRDLLLPRLISGELQIPEELLVS